MPIAIRPFQVADYPRIVEITDAIFPEYRWNPDDARRDDAAWDHEQYARQRLVAEDETGAVVGWGQFSHIPHQFRPDTYELRIEVDPPEQRLGVGGALYDRLLAELRRRGARRVRTRTKASLTESLAFVAARGFVEVERDWESRLDLTAFDFARFAGATERVAAGGITITTLADERARDPGALRAAYELHLACTRDMPRVDPVTDVPFAQFVAQQVERASALPAAYFLARHGDRFVGQSTLFRSLTEPTLFYQGMTGVLREYRGRGIALVLKLCTVRYAKEHGGREIRTANNANNRAMLRVNDALGFVRLASWITFQRTENAAGSPRPLTARRCATPDDVELRGEPRVVRQPVPSVPPVECSAIGVLVS
jgi:L-amino acid N-acyltransferase YncA